MVSSVDRFGLYDMNLRIISGKFGGRTIKSPKSRTTHPMSDRIRNSLFNIIGNEIENAKILDIFAGSGALGLEALSRGAAHVTFVERDKTACRTIADNIETLGVKSQVENAKFGASTWIEKNQDNFFDIILADPPYNDPQFSTAKRLGGLLKPNGLMVLSISGRGAVPLVNEVVVVDNRSYGNATLTFYRKK